MPKLIYLLVFVLSLFVACENRNSPDYNKIYNTAFLDFLIKEDPPKSPLRSLQADSIIHVILPVVDSIYIPQLELLFKAHEALGVLGSRRIVSVSRLSDNQVFFFMFRDEWDYFLCDTTKGLPKGEVLPIEKNLNHILSLCPDSIAAAKCATQIISAFFKVTKLKEIADTASLNEAFADIDTTRSVLRTPQKQLLCKKFLQKNYETIANNIQNHTARYFDVVGWNGLWEVRVVEDTLKGAYIKLNIGNEECYGYYHLYM